MKLNEIVFSPSSADLGNLEDVLDSLADKNEVVKQLNSKQQIGKSNNKFTFMYEGKIVGYLSMGSAVNFSGRKYLPIKMIYVLPRFRKTFALGLFIMGVSQVIEHPIVVGVDKFGGVLSPDGAELVKSLGKKKQYSVRTLNISTGEEREIQDSDFASDNHAITFAFYGNQLPLKIAEDELSEFGINFWLFENTLDRSLYSVE
jgi:hypothetical protein